ncbi:MAG: CBS domain-containing protein [Gammaproteobacteria bacterium]
MLRDITAKQYMSSNVITFQMQDDVLEAINKLLQKRITGAPVLDSHGNLVGMLSEAECIRVVLHSTYNQSMGGKVCEFMTRDFTTVDVDTSIVEVAEKFDKTWARSFPVVDDVDLVGIISRVDVLKALDSLR